MTHGRHTVLEEAAEIWSDGGEHVGEDQYSVGIVDNGAEGENVDDIIAGVHYDNL